jgi:hypothetical protein
MNIIFITIKSRTDRIGRAATNHFVALSLTFYFYVSQTPHSLDAQRMSVRIFLIIKFILSLYFIQSFPFLCDFVLCMKFDKDQKILIYAVCLHISSKKETEKFS